jgi:cytidylate kinase
MLEVVDETRANWMHDLLGSFFDSRVVSHDSYVVHLERIVQLAALHGNVVFVGRGAQVFLPRSHGLAVRVIAPRKQRIEQIMQRHNISRERATALIDEIDAARCQFCARHFHHNPEAAEEYDLIVNTGRLSLEEAADAIIAALRRRNPA